MLLELGLVSWLHDSREHQGLAQARPPAQTAASFASSCHQILGRLDGGGAPVHCLRRELLRWVRGILSYGGRKHRHRRGRFR